MFWALVPTMPWECNATVETKCSKTSYEWRRASSFTATIFQRESEFTGGDTLPVEMPAKDTGPPGPKGHLHMQTRRMRSTLMQRKYQVWHLEVWRPRPGIHEALNQNVVEYDEVEEIQHWGGGCGCSHSQLPKLWPATRLRGLHAGSKASAAD